MDSIDYNAKANVFAEPEPEQRGNIAVGREHAYKQLAELDDELRLLDKRLTPVLRAPRPVAESDVNAKQHNVDEQNRSDLAVALDDLRITARRLTRHVRDLIDRVDL